LVGAHEPAVAPLDQEVSRLLLRPSDEHVFQPVAVHVRHGNERPLGREQLRDQTLPVEIDEVVLPVGVREADLVGDVGEQRG
jgi:hypothetical protein